MKLTQITDQSLIEKTETFVREEREVLTNLLRHFKEIERRRLYCDYKFSSMHKMLVGHFGYSDEEAYRRVAAMRIVSELPELETKINEGSLSLTLLGFAHSHFRQEKKFGTEISKKSKLELLEQISSFTAREAQRFFRASSSAPQGFAPDKMTVISNEKTEYRFTANASLDKKIQELKGLLAHKYPNASLSEILEFVCDIGLEKIKNPRNSVAPLKRGTTPSLTHIRRELRMEGQHRCSNCNSNYAIEIDHIKPRARGGKDIKENLRLLCRSCNQRAAIQHFGAKTMSRYFDG